MVARISRYKWFCILPLLIVAACVLLWSQLLNLFSFQTPPHPDPAPVYIVAPYHPYTVLHFCIDGEPLYSDSYAHQAEVSVADRIDKLVAPNTGGILFYSSFISSHSFENNGVSFTVPSVKAMPEPPPLPVYRNNAFDNAKLKKTYEAALKVWEDATALQQFQLAALQKSIHQQTDRLRAQKSITDKSGSDILGCLATAAKHFQDAPGMHILLIASDMLNNSSPQEIGTLNLSGATIRVIFRTCSQDAACQASKAYWKVLVLKAGAKDYQEFDPPQSTTVGVTF